MKLLKSGIVGLISLIVAVLIAVFVAFFILSNKTKSIEDDYSAVFNSDKYKKAVMVGGIENIKQDVSCGYAVIEMFSNWNGDNITEESLYSKYGKVVTSTGKSFCKEMNKQFPQYTTTMYKYLKNTELLDRVYDSLYKGIPVPFEWAAIHDNEWTLHYSLIIGMDIPNDSVTVANPYGYIENITVKELFERASFSAYKDMPIFLKLGFAFGLFEKNTIFIVE